MANFSITNSFPAMIEEAKQIVKKQIYSPASKLSREVTNLTERKNPHTPINRRFSIRDLVVVGLVIPSK